MNTEENFIMLESWTSASSTLSSHEDEIDAENTGNVNTKDESTENKVTEEKNEENVESEEDSATGDDSNADESDEVDDKDDNDDSNVSDDSWSTESSNGSDNGKKVKKEKELDSSFIRDRKIKEWLKVETAEEAAELDPRDSAKVREQRKKILCENLEHLTKMKNTNYDDDDNESYAPTSLDIPPLNIHDPVENLGEIQHTTTALQTGMLRLHDIHQKTIEEYQKKLQASEDKCKVLEAKNETLKLENQRLNGELFCVNFQHSLLLTSSQLLGGVQLTMKKVAQDMNDNADLYERQLAALKNSTDPAEKETSKPKHFDEETKL